MFLRRHFFPVLVLAAFALLTACGNHDAKPAVPKSVEDHFPLKLGEQIVQVQVAALPAETQKGLMYRKGMGSEQGMIFVFDRVQIMSFWMRHTEIPLDIGFLDANGVLREIYPMYPHDERPVVSRGRMQFALEMNQGWYRASGVRPGAQLDLAALAEALKARGLKPADYGLR